MNNNTTVFSITYDIESFPILEEVSLELTIQATSGDLLDLHGKPLSKKWTPLNLKWFYDDQNLENGLPDIALWRAGEYACSEEILPIIKKITKNSCEFLPLKVGEANWFAIHTLKTVDAIDREQTIFNLRANGKVNRTKKFKKLVLKSDVINEAGLCHVKDAGLHTYCSEAFHSEITNMGIRGLIFNKRQTS
ncbi:hypothetical protein MSP8886_00724 [Marinomonas spartinae]|uniref:Immunity MXAN-0049 protein domain-containing protein n=1 Tax=Marinomonas spartinae TaxID=1792290 RepID=A0A1A8T6C0_9GAMM|nr:DUF1629 domain-containing protein [Marinomonas spartinae]SBS26856.1 hypothetical protein MSP8886_00724 [Marinomonas spartinae]